MTEKQYRFVCLDPRKAKRQTIAEVLSPGGPIKWLRMAPMGLRSFPESVDEASKAMAMSKDRNQGRFMQWLNRLLLQMQYNGSRTFFSKNADAVAVCWNGLNGTRRVFMQGAKAAGAKQLFFELAPFPGRVTVDPSGVNFANSLAREIGPYRDWHAHTKGDDWRTLGEGIKQRKSLKSSDGASNAPPLSEPFLFAALQTPGDSQLRLFGGAYPTVPNFIAALSEAAKHLPDGWHLRIKEHPTAPTSFAQQILAAADNRVYLDNQNDTFAQVAASRGVVTVNSSVGLEAMFFDKPVIACGQCFWAIEGVAMKAETPEDMIRICETADTLTVDYGAREAFLAFLNQRYYPRKAVPDDFPLIAERLAGDDAFGIWRHTS